MAPEPSSQTCSSERPFGHDVPVQNPWFHLPDSPPLVAPEDPIEAVASKVMCVEHFPWKSKGYAPLGTVFPSW
jgi:hypothetical protein